MFGAVHEIGLRHAPEEGGGLRQCDFLKGVRGLKGSKDHERRQIF